MPEDMKKDIKIHLVDTVTEVMEVALAGNP